MSTHSTLVESERTMDESVADLVEETEIDAREHAWLRVAFDEAPAGIAVISANARFLKVNRSMSRMLGYSQEELLAMRPSDAVHEEDRLAFQAAVSRALESLTDNLASEHRWVRKDGEVVWVRFAASVIRRGEDRPYCLVAGCEDISREKEAAAERHSLEMQLRRTQRMQAVGRLAGGIAHDFNNMLSIILNYADFARRVSADGRARDYLDAIRKGALRAAGLTRQLLIFGRRDTATQTVVNVNEVVAELERLLRRTLGEDIEFVVDLADDLHNVWIALPHAEQIVMNLAVNARDAMPKGGRLLLRTENVRLTEEDVKNRVDAKPGDYTCLTVQDTGIGMTEDVLALAFDPFFTTKEPGEGTGLGLSIVYGIVQEAGGHIDVESAPGAGSTFRVYLPMTEAPRSESEPILVRAPQGRGESVLVVEDEPAVRALTVQILRESGYRVEEAADPDIAMDICRRREKPFDLLLADVIMPRMSGADLAMHIRAVWRETRVLFMSGYAADRLDEYRSHHADVVLLQKPFNGEELLHAMRRTLEEAEA